MSITIKTCYLTLGKLQHYAIRNLRINQHPKFCRKVMYQWYEIYSEKFKRFFEEYEDPLEVHKKEEWLDEVIKQQLLLLKGDLNEFKVPYIDWPFQFQQEDFDLFI